MAFEAAGRPRRGCLAAGLESLTGSDSPSVRHPHRGLRCTNRNRRSFAIQVLPCSKFPAPRPPSGFPPHQKNPGPKHPPRPPLPSAASAGRCLWVESHSDVFATWRWACEAVKTANCLRTHLPAVFAVQRSMPYAMSNTEEGETYRHRPARVPCPAAAPEQLPRPFVTFPPPCLSHSPKPAKTHCQDRPHQKNTPVTAHQQQGWSYAFFTFSPQGTGSEPAPRGD
jgi:hypothetical protein